MLQIRLEYVVHAVEKKEWPVPRQCIAMLPATPTESPSSPVVSSAASGSELTPHATPEHTPAMVVREQHPPPPPPLPPPVLVPDMSSRLSPAAVAPSVPSPVTIVPVPTAPPVEPVAAAVPAGRHSPVPPIPVSALLLGRGSCATPVLSAILSERRLAQRYKAEKKETKVRNRGGTR